MQRTDDGLGRARPAEPAELAERALFEVKRVIVGQDRMIERVMVCLLARGHCLLEGVPGLAKTLTVETLAKVVGGSFTRVQFTPDLVPADLVGTRIYRPSREEFDVEWGPVFANLVLADEINRAPAKVQSALLEVMAERQVSIGGRTQRLPDPFLVLATQNPIESEGVYPLPEAQRDRFLMKIVIGHPTEQDEMEIVRRMSVTPPEPQRILALEDVLALQAATTEVFVHHEVASYAVRIVQATRRPSPQIALGASPRATLGLVAAGRALALLRGREFVLPEDILDVAPEILRHRILLTYDALAEDVDVDDLLARLLPNVPAPRVAPRQDDSDRLAAAGAATNTATNTAATAAAS